MGLWKGEIVVTPEAVLSHTMADNPITTIQGVEPAFLLPAIRKPVSIIVSVRVQLLWLFRTEASRAKQAADQQ